jgi:hypothetical protein
MEVAMIPFEEGVTSKPRANDGSMAVALIKATSSPTSGAAGGIPTTEESEDSALGAKVWYAS